ncbi:MAG: alpha/beta hydrolase [Hyphomicrobiaceae bacterium]
MSTPNPDQSRPPPPRRKSVALRVLLTFFFGILAVVAVTLTVLTVQHYKLGDILVADRSADKEAEPADRRSKRSVPERREITVGPDDQAANSRRTSGGRTRSDIEVGATRREFSSEDGATGAVPSFEPDVAGSGAGDIAGATRGEFSDDGSVSGAVPSRAEPEIAASEAEAMSGTTRDALAPDDSPFATVRVFYATDRKRTGSLAPNEMYGGERGELVYGTAEVSIPRDHREGELEAPSIWRLEFREDPERHVVLLSAKEQPVDDFYREVAAQVAGSGGKMASIFVHGFNVTFKDAARRTAQMSYDLGFDGAAAFYSWPSAGTLSGYAFDETNIAWTEPHLKQFIEDFVTRSNAAHIYLVAHSMGNRALTSVLKQIGRERPDVRQRITGIILAAPDIDADIFKRDIAPYIVTEKATVTLYTSANDKALEASYKVHGYARVGDSAAGITVAPGIDTIDSTGVETDFLGHAYYAESKSIITDMFDIINRRLPPDERPHLQPIEAGSGRYWRFVTGG